MVCSNETQKPEPLRACDKSPYHNLGHMLASSVPAISSLIQNFLDDLAVLKILHGMTMPRIIINTWTDVLWDLVRWCIS